MKKILAILLVAMLFIGCGTSRPLNPRYINSPASFSPAFFKEKGDAKISLDVAVDPTQIGGSKRPRDKSSGVGTQAAYAITDHFFMTAGWLARNETDYYFDNDITGSKTPSTIEYKRRNLDIGIGYYGALNEKRSVFFNGTIGFAVGNARSLLLDDDTRESYFFNGRVNKFYINPSIQFFFSPYFRMALLPKFSLLRYNNFNTNYSEGSAEHVGFSQLYDHSFVFGEPSLAFQWGFKKAKGLKLDAGLNFTSTPDLKSPNFFGNDGLNSRWFLFSLGFSIYPQKRK